MAEISEAIIIGGYSEFEDSLWPLTNAVSNGPHRLVENATPKTLNWAVENPEELAAIAKDKLVIAHSFGAVMVKKAGLFVVLNGVEPTPLHRTIVGAIKVNAGSGKEEGVPSFGQMAPIRELWSNKRVAVTTPFKVRSASSLQTLINGGREAYPEGRVYLPRFDDEFKFGQNGEVDMAREYGITAYMLEGHHNDPLSYPARTTAELQDILANG